MKRTFEDVIKGFQTFRKEISGSIDVLKSFKDNHEELQARLEMILKFNDLLLQQLMSNLEIKANVIGKLHRLYV